MPEGSTQTWSYVHSAAGVAVPVVLATCVVFLVGLWMATSLARSLARTANVERVRLSYKRGWAVVEADFASAVELERVRTQSAALKAILDRDDAADVLAAFHRTSTSTIQVPSWMEPAAAAIE